jgi:ZIP family zinc transporter
MSTLFSGPVLIAFSVTVFAALATVIGALIVVNANRSNPRMLAFGLAFAGGAMVYISLVEIFGKSVTSFTETYGEATGYRFATLAFFCGIGLLVLLDRLVPNPHAGLETPPRSLSAASVAAPAAASGLDPAKIGRVGLLAALAITAHNFPEGLATFFATLESPAVGAPLAFAIAVHNIPEGVSIAIPVY